MKLDKHLIICLLALLIFTPVCLAGSDQHQLQNAAISTSKTALSLPFITNTGQCAPEVCFYSSTIVGNLFITEKSEIVCDVGGLALREQFVEGSVHHPVGEDAAPTRMSRFVGQDQRHWQRDIPVYNLIDLGEVYTGIDVKLSFSGNNVEKLFFVHPGADPNQIQIKVDQILTGTDDAELTFSSNQSGQLEIHTAGGAVTCTRPMAYQSVNGIRQYVPVEYRWAGNQYGFALGDYNSDNELIIDPLLASSFIGGNYYDEIYETRLVRNSVGENFVTGNTISPDFPIGSGGYQDSHPGGIDRWVLKFDSTLSELLAATYLGGYGEEKGMGIYCNDSNQVYVAGYTRSNNFPVTDGCYNANRTGGLDMFLCLLDDDLTTLLASTYFGGSVDDGFQWPRIDVVTGASGDVYVAGITKSADLPTTPGAFDTSYGGGFTDSGGDAFVAKFSADLTDLLGSTFLGGSGDEWRVSIAIDAEENVFVTGDTYGYGFPITTGAYDQTFNGNYDFFISKFTSDLTTLSASTYLGSPGGDDPLGMKIDENGDVYISGFAQSGFPTTPGAYDRYCNGTMDACISKLSSDLTALLASTFIGGSGSDAGEDIALGNNDDLYITGRTDSQNFPVTSGAYNEDNSGSLDVIVARLNRDLTELTASTYVGSTNDERGQSIIMGTSGAVYVTGQTTSSNFPTTPGSFDTSYNGGGHDNFVFKLDPFLTGGTAVVDDETILPEQGFLHRNYPNPFPQSTMIRYSLASSSRVRITVHDLTGRRLETLVDGLQPAGDFQIKWNASDYPAGMYYCRVNRDGGEETRVMSIIR